MSHYAVPLDQIHLKDGSIIVGVVVEHNVVEQKYKIKTSNGSILAYRVDEIIKITKDSNPSPSANIPNSNHPNIVINNNVNPNSQPAPMQSPPAVVHGTSTINKNNVIINAAETATRDKHWQLYLGISGYESSYNLTYTHVWIDPDNYSRNFGVSAAFNKHLTLQLGENRGNGGYATQVIKALLETNALHNGWSWQLGLVRLLEPDYVVTPCYTNYNLSCYGNRIEAINAVHLGVSYSWDDIKLSYSYADFNNIDYMSPAESIKMSEFSIGIRF